MSASRLGMLSGMSSTQIAVRVPDGLLARLDALVEDGHFENRAEAVRRSLERLVIEIEADRVSAAIVAGYLRHPVADSWGDLDRARDWGTAGVLDELERAERDQGLEW